MARKDPAYEQINLTGGEEEKRKSTKREPRVARKDPGREKKRTAHKQKRGKKKRKKERESLRREEEPHYCGKQDLSVQKMTGDIPFL